MLLFAGLREAVGRKEILLEAGASETVGGVLARLEAQEPAVARYRGRLVISLNAARAALDAQVADGDEIALLPPVSGGSAAEPFADAAWIQPAPLSMDALLARVVGAEHGGVCTFTGIVRNHARGAKIDHLEYEAYGPMAEREMRRIVEQARARWPAVRLAIAHRVGRLEIGEAAVMIAAASPHRPEAFDACRFAIDTLKKTVPIWKKEFGSSGEYWVEENP